MNGLAGGVSWTQFFEISAQSFSKKENKSEFQIHGYGVQTEIFLFMHVDVPLVLYTCDLFDICVYQCCNVTEMQIIQSCSFKSTGIPNLFSFQGVTKY